MKTILPIIIVIFLAGCVQTVPAGNTVLSLPAVRSDFDQSQIDHFTGLITPKELEDISIFLEQGTKSGYLVLDATKRPLILLNDKQKSVLTQIMKDKEGQFLIMTATYEQTPEGYKLSGYRIPRAERSKVEGVMRKYDRMAERIERERDRAAREAAQAAVEARAREKYGTPAQKAAAQKAKATPSSTPASSGAKSLVEPELRSIQEQKSAQEPKATTPSPKTTAQPQKTKTDADDWGF